MAYKGKRVAKPTRTQKIFAVLGTLLCVIFGFTLCCNLAIIIKGTVNPDSPPSVLGKTPLVVLSGSMSGDAPDHIETGDLIIVDKAEASELNVGDVISFKQGKVIVTHRIIEISSGENGELLFTTQGDANGTPDEKPVREDALVGIFKFRIPKVGDLAIFMQTPLGMLIFVGLPLLSFIIYDIVRRQRSANKESQKTAELQAEIDRLRALAAEKDDIDI